jgi:hypothetical protein
VLSSNVNNRPDHQEATMSNEQKQAMIERRKVLKQALRKERADQFCDQVKVERMERELQELNEVLMLGLKLVLAR